MDASGEVRTRLAPSPTGDPHVGTAYQALFDYVWARKNNGKFVLRIEDTDRERSTQESEKAILDSLGWLGLEWDEGPDVGGPFGPYRQSERTDIYREHVDMLLEGGHAYPCFCTRERLEEVRTRLSEEGASARGYDLHCRDLDPADAASRIDNGEPYVVRMKVPLEGECVWTDLLRGEMRKDWASIDDQVILKADGFPTYHLAVVVDDHLMRISHIIRGEEWINSVPKHMLLYGFFEWEPPVFCHLPLLRNSDRSKLSKRKNPVSVNYYRRAGFLPEALLNYLGMMGWSMPDGTEKFSVEEMTEAFRLEDVSLGGPVFDRDKLRWLNGRYLREDLTPGELVEKLYGWNLNSTYVGRIAELVRGRLETLGDWGEITVPFFCDGVSPDPERLVLEGFDCEGVKGILQMTVWEMEKLESFDSEVLEKLFRDSSERLGLKLRDFTKPFYVAVTGRTVSAPLFGTMEILGSDMVRMRIMAAIEALGGISGKRLRKLEKEYESELASRE